VEQSGHINSIGFGLYCQLLKRTIATFKNDTLPPIIDVDTKLDFIDLSANAATPERSAVIPYSYIEDEHLRVATYKRMAEAATLDDVSSLRAELADRFGTVPPEVDRLFKIAHARILACRKAIDRMETRDGNVILLRRNDYIKTGSRFPRLTGASADACLDELIKLLEGLS
jgi:transcription-repair coupling factor (superfamily II helicase)